MRVLILGITGMLGNAMFRVLSADPNLTIYGTARSTDAPQYFSEQLSTKNKIISDLDVENHDSLLKVFAHVQPNVVINCVGVVKQLQRAYDTLQTLAINTMLPHRLVVLCKAIKARLIHISTDCVFSGVKGNYLETDFPDANDLYGRSKLLGEVDCPHTLTIRTSIIGHELSGSRNLIGWFLSQEQAVQGFTRAIFSGLPTVELAQIMRDIVLLKPELHGLYHVAAKPINKYDLLKLVASIYKKTIEIIPEENFIIDRSLNATRFNHAVGYTAPAWPELIQRMHQFH